MKLSTFLESQGTYVGIRLDEASKKEIIRLQETLRLENPLDADKFHVTVLYSRKQVDVPQSDAEYSAKIEYIDCWETKDGNHAVVAKMKCPELVARHDDLISIGGTHDYPDYTPHVTLSYDDMITPVFVDCDVRLVDEYIEPLDLNWTDNNG